MASFTTFVLVALMFVAGSVHGMSIWGSSYPSGSGSYGYGGSRGNGYGNYGTSGGGYGGGYGLGYGGYGGSSGYGGGSLGYGTQDSYSPWGSSMSGGISSGYSRPSVIIKHIRTTDYPYPYSVTGGYQNY